MIISSFNRLGDGTLQIKVDGHAGQNEFGVDIVCSAASILVYTLAQIATDLTTENKIKGMLLSIDSGHAEITFKPKKTYIKEIMTKVCVAQTGFELLAHNFPEYVAVKTFDQDE